MPPKLPLIVFFDLDETLVQNTSDFVAILDSVLTERFPEIGSAERRGFMAALRRSAESNWQNMFSADSKRPVGNAWFGAAFETIGQPYHHGEQFATCFVEKASAATRIIDQALETLDFIRDRGIKTGVITNGFTQLQFAKLKTHKLMEHLDFPVASQQAGAHKPDPRVFNYALDLAKLPADCAWHVGDHLKNDVSGAKSVGMTAVHFDPDLQEAVASEADYRISQLSELQSLLNR